MAKKIHKSHGLFLNSMLGIYILLIIFIAVYSILTFNKTVASLSTGEVIVNFLRNGALAISVAGIMVWKKMAVFLFIILLSFEILSMSLSATAFNIINTLPGIILPLLLLFAAFRKWQFFK